MIQSLFGEFQFDTGWKARDEIVLFGRLYSVTIKVRAYTETDGITNAQKESLSDFKRNRDERLQTIESMLTSYADDDAKTRFKPRTLLFDRSGEYALLCDDTHDLDDGVAVVLMPKQKIVLQDDYL